LSLGPPGRAARVARMTGFSRRFRETGKPLVVERQPASEPSKSLRALMDLAQRLVEELGELSVASAVARQEGEVGVADLFAEVLAARSTELARVRAELKRRPRW
jgi:hypothetical protein